MCFWGSSFLQNVPLPNDVGDDLCLVPDDGRVADRQTVEEIHQDHD